MTTLFITYASILLATAILLWVRYKTMDYKTKAEQKANQFYNDSK